MTLPDERFRAVIAAEQFLADLCDSKKTPRVPAAVRRRASMILRHYPGSWDMIRAAEACPQVFTPKMEELHRFIAAGSIDKGEKS
jgi:hypothetical protein